MKMLMRLRKAGVCRDFADVFDSLFNRLVVLNGPVQNLRVWNGDYSVDWCAALYRYTEAGRAKWIYCHQQAAAQQVRADSKEQKA